MRVPFLIINQQTKEIYKVTAHAEEARMDEPSPTITEFVSRLEPGVYDVFVENGDVYDFVMEIQND